jgi:alpha-glucosidase (family GH31 glycosyl hydrolase)
MYLGAHLIACPVVADGARQRDVYFPDAPGGWYDVWTGEHVASGQRLAVEAPLDTLPLFGRAGGVVALDPPSLSTALAEPGTLTLWTFPGTGSTSFYFDDGISFAYRDGDWTRLHVDLDADAEAGLTAAIRREGTYGVPHHHVEWRIPLAGLGDARTVRVDGSEVALSPALGDAEIAAAEDGAWLVVRTRTDVDRVEVR